MEQRLESNQNTYNQKNRRERERERMDRVYSVGEISDQFWSAPPAPAPATPDDTSKMNRSASEWAFQRFLQETSASASDSSPPPPPPPPPPRRSEIARPCSSSASDPNDVVEIKVSPTQVHDNNSSCNDGGKPTFHVAPPPNVPIDSEEYQAFLKSKLNLACAAVALTRVKYWFLFFSGFLITQRIGCMGKLMKMELGFLEVGG